MRFLKQLFNFEREATRGERLFFRGFELFVIYWTLYFAWKWGLYISKISDVILPLGIAQYVDISFMFQPPFPLLNAGLISAFALLGFFNISRFGYLGALVLMHLQYVSRFCLGEISHGSNIIGFCLMGLALSPIVFSKRDYTIKATLGFCYFFIGMGYTSAAICKLVATGPMWVDGSHMWMWIAERTVDTFSLTGAIEYSTIQSMALNSKTLATLILTFGLVTELFGFLFWFNKTRPYIATLLFAMHIGILLSMKINFPANNYVLIVLGYPWASLIDYLLDRLRSSPGKNLIPRFQNW